MDKKNLHLSTNRRKFIGTIASGAAAMSLAGFATPLQSIANDAMPILSPDDPEAWLKKLTGKHKLVFDAAEPNGIFPFAWPRIFLVTNEMTGTPQKDTNVVVVLRHNAIPYAMNNTVWTKYNLGEVFKITDDKTKATAVRNAFYQPAAGDFSVPGLGNVAIGINELQTSGVIFCVCNMAMTVYSAAIAQQKKLSHEDVYNDFKAAVLPGINIVPSGLWAIGRAQEHGCGYCRA
jgi:intracellular sulfur oxidation DsrE/DsrF family protein